MIKRLFNLFKQKTLADKGMGLVEVMIASAILGGLTLVIMKVIEQGNQGVTRVEKSIDAADFDREVVTFIGLKAACTQTVGTPSLASISGNNKLTLNEIKNETGAVVLTVGDKRGTVELIGLEVHSYDALTKMASLTKTFRFRLSPSKLVTRTKTSKISVTPDPGNTNLSECIATSSVNSSIWTVDDYGIFYDDKTVFIGKDGGTSQGDWQLVVEGNMGSGVGHFVQNAGSLKASSIIAGNGNMIRDFFQASNTPIQNSVIVGGQSNKLYDQRSDLSALNNVVAGGETNLIDSTNHAVIAGGGLNFVEKTSGIGSVVAGGNGNWITGDKSTSPEFGSWESQPRPYGSNMIAGGLENLISRAENSFIGGGYKNTALYEQNTGMLAGQWNSVSGQDSAIVGGSYNTISSGINSAAIIGGSNNDTASSRSIVLASNNSTINTGSDYSSIISSRNSKVLNNAYEGVIIGGIGHRIESDHSEAVIIGGNYSTITSTAGIPNSFGAIINSAASKITGGSGGTIIGGTTSTVTAYKGAIFNSVATVKSRFAVAIGGGGVGSPERNELDTNASNSVIAGGFLNTVNCPQCFIGGGNNNNVHANGFSDNIGNTTIGGSENTLTGGDKGHASIIGGWKNNNDGSYSSIIGGDLNSINNRAWTSVILGGKNNTISSTSPENAARSVILAGANNLINGGGAYSAILGGRFNTISAQDSLASGTSANVNHTGTVLMKDGDSVAVSTNNSDTFTAKFKNGHRLCTNTSCDLGLFTDSTGKIIAAGYSSSTHRGLAIGYKNSAKWRVASRSTAGGLDFVHDDFNIRMQILSSGNLRIAGTLTQNFSWSDMRLKSDVQKLKNVSEKLKTLNGYSFKYKSNDQESIGVSAQELEKVFPQLVYRSKRLDDDSTEYRAVRYELLSAILVEAFKEQQQQIEENQKMFQIMHEGLDSRVQNLEREVAALKEENALMQEKMDLIMKRLEKLENK